MTSRTAAVIGVAVLAIAAAVARFHPQLVELLAVGEVRVLRDTDHDTKRHDATRPRLLVIALDGVDRELLYRMLRAGELPTFDALLAGRSGTAFPHACLAEDVLTVLPSTTIPAWTSAFTGVAPSVHGITGNELFIREEATLFAPAPVSFTDLSPTVAVYVDDSLDARVSVETVYEKLRAREPHLSIWVAMSQIHRGADRLILAKRSVLVGAIGAWLQANLADGPGRGVYAELDEEVVDATIEELEDENVPDVLTVYLVGTDLYAHHSSKDPDAARRSYLREVVDPKLRELRDALEARGFFENAYTIVVSDHGHTEVVHDDLHALGTGDGDEPPDALASAGFRVRPLAWKIDDEARDFQAVLAYNGAIAFVYLADRSTCREPGVRCEWMRPPRFEEDVLPAAEALARWSASPSSPALSGVLDMILVRRAVEDPFVVYEAGGRMVGIEQYLAEKPHPSYVKLAPRLRDLAGGAFGARAGDMVLIAMNGDVDDPAKRFYFAAKYRSWHGSPSRQDSEIPFVVAHPRRAERELCGLVRGADTSDGPPSIRILTPVMIRARSGE